jgi:hypothetical protein
MSEEKKEEDFVGMLKRMKTDMKSPSVIGDALDKLELLQKENEELKDQLNKSINLIHSSEQVLQKALDEKERLKEDGRVAMEKLGEDIIDLKNKVKDLQNSLLEKNELLQQKEKEVSELITIADSTSKELEDKKKAIPQTDSAVSQDSSAELAKKDKYIYELEERVRNLEQHIAELAEENANLNKKITEQPIAMDVDYVVPVVEATTTAKKPEPAPSSVSTLEALCQDLQSDLNKYKRIMDSLKAENTELKKALDAKGISKDFDEINTLRNENVSLKAKVIDLEKSLEEQTLEVTLSLDSENKIKEFQNQLNEKDILINELKASQTSQPAVQSGPMANLVEELQARINKMKITLSEKDKIIEDLKNKG